ncbi:hypothetical protein EVA_08091 [gut metagenome]|uniref:Uncharacterized protein n=1 Tax=gut metagenome TaxID=749906 RepID=J9GAD3_9ZZZZ
MQYVLLAFGFPGEESEAFFCVPNLSMRDFVNFITLNC